MGADPTLAADLDARLSRIELPGMHVHERGLALTVHAADAPAQVAVGQEAQVRAAAQRPVAAGGSRGTHRKLDERALAVFADHEGESAGVRNPVEPNGDREDARVVAESAIEQHVEGP